MTADDIEALAELGPAASRRRARSPFTPARVLLQDFTGVPAVVDLAAMRDAHGGARRRPDRDQPAAAGRPRHRPLGAGRRLRHATTRSSSTPSSSSSATASATRSCAGARTAFDNFRVVPPGTGIVPPGQPRVPGARRLSSRTSGRAVRVPRHAGRHRLAHHDDQRPRRAGLGRRRHRGRGGDARPADLDADPAGRRLQADGQAARGRDGHRPRADRHRDAAQARAWSASSSSSTAPAWRTCRSPTARRSPTWRRSTARRGLLPGRRRDAALPGFTGRSAEQVELVEAYCRRRACSATPTRRSRRTRDTLELDLATVEPSLAGPQRPQDRVPLSDAKRRSASRELASGEVEHGLGRRRRRSAQPATRR